MSHVTYDIIFVVVFGASAVAGLAYNAVISRRARRSLAAGAAQIPVDFAVMRRIARTQYKQLTAAVFGCFVALLLVVGSRIDDATALFVIPGLSLALLTLAGHVARRQRLQRMIPTDSHRVMSDGQRLFLLHDDTHLVTWLSASPTALADAGVFPAAKLRQP